MQENWLKNYYRTKARFCREAAAFARGNLKTEADPVKSMGILAVIQFMTGKARRYERDALLAGRWGPLMRRLGVRPIPVSFPIPTPIEEPVRQKLMDRLSKLKQ